MKRLWRGVVNEVYDMLHDESAWMRWAMRVYLICLAAQLVGIASIVLDGISGWPY